MPLACETIVEQNRASISRAITELLVIREYLPEDIRTLLDRTIERLNDALASDELYLRSLRSDEGATRDTVPDHVIR